MQSTQGETSGQRWQIKNQLMNEAREAAFLALLAYQPPEQNDLIGKLYRQMEETREEGVLTAGE